MSDNRTYERIIRYLKGLLSDRERHDLEKDMMRDPFDDDAFEGLSRMHGDDVEKDLSSLLSRLDERTAKAKRRTSDLRMIYRIAAGLVLIVGISAALYLVLHKPQPTPVISQDLHVPKESPAPETGVGHQAPAMPEKVLPQEKPLSDRRMQPADKKMAENNAAMADSLVTEMPAIQKSENEIPAGYRKAAAPVIAEAADTVDTGYSREYITGRVLGVNRQALQGVTVMEEGTAITAMTDRNGNFRLPVRNPSSRIALKYSGYKPMEVPSREIAGKEISMNEDMPPLNEVLVTGYGQRKAKQTAGGESRAATGETAYKYYKPVPPGGSLKAFQEWVESRIDVEKFMELLPGNYKVTVDLTIGVDGTLNQVSVRDGVPVEVADEYRRVVASSPAWQPAKANETYIDANIRLVFTLILQ